MRILALLLFTAAYSITVLGQTNPKTSGAAAGSGLQSSPAYAEILFRRTELTAELESLLLDYTEEYPKVKDLRLELELLRSESDRLIALKSADTPKLTLALGRLILGKVAHLANLRRLQLQYKDEHPAVRKEKKMVDVFEAAIKEILG